MGIVYLQSMIIVRVSLSLASWNGACPQTSMYRITPRDHTSATAHHSLCSVYGHKRKNPASLNKDFHRIRTEYVHLMSGGKFNFGSHYTHRTNITHLKHDFEYSHPAVFIKSKSCIVIRPIHPLKYSDIPVFFKHATCIGREFRPLSGTITKI